MPANPIHLYKTEEEIYYIKKAAYMAAKVLDETCKQVKPGVTTAELDKFAEDWIRSHGAVPTFKGYMGFPASICVGTNQEIVHGIPSESAVLKEGDIFSIDIGVTIEEVADGVKQKFVGDNAKTVGVGQISPKHQKLIDDTKYALEQGVAQCIAGNKVSDIARAVEAISNKERYGSVREFGGHGIGPEYHCDPFIPNYLDYFKHLPDVTLETGMVLAIEPMFTLGLSKIRMLKDKWTVVTRDNKYAAHYEYSVFVTEGEPEIITTINPKTKFDI